MPDSELFSRLYFRGRPAADPDSVVTCGQARFTVLTPRLLRLEWSKTGQFEDRGTYAFPTRCGPTLPFAVRHEGDSLLLDTGALVLRYTPSAGPFAAENLSITLDLNGAPQTWRPGVPNPGNLRGTRRTLDGCEADATVEEGLLSRAGWALFDDSRNAVFEDGWVAPRPAEALQDWYFFGYGHDYKGALAEYARFGGPVPLIPRFVLGAWWSRYWAYSAEDLQELVQDFERHGVPLDVLVLDMDWHTADSWTGYTWNRQLFPDPPGFLRWAHGKGLRVTLNLHPAEGIQAFEEIYPRFAAAMGVDPASREPVPFRIADKRFVQPYFELLHHPMEDEGVDFWWMDWQQGTTSEIQGLDPLPWINHLHFSDSTRRGQRPLLYSRWGGLGNHRHPIGFSGDTVVGWPALQFQPYLTATAANVGCGWWSHDIGGHMGGDTAPELYARWVQFGALSPCLRLHATKDARAERRPWMYPDEVFQAVRAAFLLRYQLIPYLYTMARVHTDTGLPLCRPMYYEHPEEEAAYAARYQYFLGDDLLAAPIVHPADPATGLAAANVWIPPGTWIDWATEETFTGPRWARLVGDLARIPLLVRAGAILPLAGPPVPQPAPHLSSGTSADIPADRLVLDVYPGPAGRFRLYEDDGTTPAYQAGQCEWTEITARRERENAWVVHVAPVEGRCDALPGERAWEVRLHGCQEPRHVVVSNQDVADWDYDPARRTVTVHVPRRGKRRPLTVTVLTEGPITALGPEHNQALALADARRLLGGDAGAAPGLLDAALRGNTPAHRDAVARLGGPFARFLEFTTLEEASQQLGRVIVGAPTAGDPYGVEVEWTLQRADRQERHTVQVENATTPQILNAPFAFDGQIETLHWAAQARLSWRGHVLTYTHRSRMLFPPVHTWRVLVYNPERDPLPLGHVLAGEDALPWTVRRPDVAALRNLNGPFLLPLGQENRERLQAGEPLAAYLATTVMSPDEQEASLLVRTRTPVVVYLNGEAVPAGPGEEDCGYYPFEVRRAGPFRLHAGENRLVVHSLPDPAGQAVWFAAATLTW
jgi:alpha-glucosidase